MISKCVIFVLQDEDHLNRLPSHLMNTGDRLATFMFYVSIITMTSWWARWRLKSPASPCLLNCWFRCSSKKTSKLRVSGLCAGNSPVTGEFPAQWASNPENVSIWWRHHVEQLCAVIEKKKLFWSEYYMCSCLVNVAYSLQCFVSCHACAHVFGTSPILWEDIWSHG